MKKGLCILKRKEEFIYTRNRHIGPAFAPSIDRGVQNQAFRNKALGIENFLDNRLHILSLIS